jgi:hypothetical protein
MGWFVDYAKKRVKNNKNLLAVFLGQTGSGKTYASLRYAEMIDKEFNIDRVVFSTKEFMNVLNSGLKSGSVVVYDEIGVGHAARQWYSMANQMFNYILQTFRHRNIIVLFSTPDIGFLDKGARKLLHLTFETVGIDKENNLCVCKPLLTQNNPTYSKIYRKYPVIIRKGRQQTIKRIAFDLPSQELIDKYEEKKSEYTKKLNKMVLQKIKKQEQREIKINKKEFMEKLINMKDQLMKENIIRTKAGKMFVDWHLLKDKFNLKYVDAKTIKTMTDARLNNGD